MLDNYNAGMLILCKLINRKVNQMFLYELIDEKYNTNLGMYITHIGEEYLNFPKEIQESYDKLQEQLGLDIPGYE